MNVDRKRCENSGRGIPLKPEDPEKIVKKANMQNALRQQAYCLDFCAIEADVR